jgi:predicted dehydrogenase
MDKPMWLTSHEAWTMMAAAEKAKRVLTVFCNRAAGKWQTLRRQIKPA